MEQTKKEPAEFYSVFEKFYLLCIQDTGNPVLPDVFLEALQVNRNRTFQILLYCIDRQSGFCHDEAFVAVMDAFVHTKLLNITFKYKVVKALVRMGKWNIIVEILKHTPNAKLRVFVFREIKKALEMSNIRCAAYMPRNGEIANRIRGYLKLSPTQWRAQLVPLCKNQISVLMSSNKWDQLDYSKLPTSLLVKYHRAIRRHDKQRFEEYLNNTPARAITIKRILARKSNVKSAPPLSEVLTAPSYFGKPLGGQKCFVRSAR